MVNNKNVLIDPKPITSEISLAKSDEVMNATLMGKVNLNCCTLNDCYMFLTYVNIY